MSGFGGLVAASVVALICTLSIMLISNTVFMGLTAYNSKVSNVLSKIEIKAIPQIDNGVITPSTTSIAKVNVTNIGGQGIRIRDFIKSDLIVVYFNGTHRKAVRLSYSDSEAPNTWSISRVLVGNKEGDTLNPINPKLKTGIWDPGETLELKLVIQDYVNVSKSWSVVLALPNGVVTTAEF